MSALARVSADERRERILEAAREVFIASGLNGARTKDISDRAGVAEGLIFKHFESKEGLFEAAVTAPLERMLAGVVETAKSMATSAPEDRIAASEALHDQLQRTMVDVMPLLGLGLFSDRARGERFYREHIAPLIEESSRLVGEAMAGWANPEPDPRFVFLVMWGTHLALALDATFQDGPVDIEAAARELTALLSRSYSQPHRKAGTRAAKR